MMKKSFTNCDSCFQVQEANSNVDNGSDQDDEEPLMVTEAPARNRPSRQTARYSDEHVNQTKTGSSNTAKSSTRSTRTQKRSHCTEDPDEEDSYRAKLPTSHARYVFKSND